MSRLISVKVLFLVLVILLVGVILEPSLQNSSLALANSQVSEAKLLEEHMYGELPVVIAQIPSQVLVRNAYVLSYNSDRRVANWVAYHLKPDYLNKPPRDGPFDDFRLDPDLSYPVDDKDYDGLFKDFGYARGHLVPFNVSGGDRDGDGLYAIKDNDGDGKFTKNDKNESGKYIIDDPDDEETIYQIMYMSNIAPQNHYDFNGAGGLWYELERWIQDDLVEEKQLEVWVIAGSIFGPGKVEKVGPHKDIHVSSMFYKILVQRPSSCTRSVKALAFLFPHQRESHGEIEDFLVSIDIIESLSGFDFFTASNDGIDESFERQDTFLFWEDFS